MFEIIKPGTKFEFIGRTKTFMVFSAIMLTVSVGAMIVRTYTNGAPLNFGTDFTGGTEIQLSFNEEVPTADVRSAAESLGFPSAEVQAMDTGGDTHNYLVRIREQVTLLDSAGAAGLKKALEAGAPKLGTLLKFDPASAGDRVYLRFDKDPDQAALKGVFEARKLDLRELERTGRPQDNTFTAHLVEIQGKMKAHFSATFGGKFLDIAGAQVVGPKAGARLRNDGLLALLVALGAILIYIAVRFDFRFAPGAILALIHDVIITVGLFSLFWQEFTLSTVAALLTIVGYSLNDTIVIFDRIREALVHSHDKDLAKVTNQALNDTLSRTLLTSLTTLIVVVAIFVFGGSLIRTFALALMIGVVFGTYSSIGVASPMMLWMHRVLPSLKDLLGPDKKAAARARKKA